VLEELLRGTELDFFALCSSLATAIVGVGQADYFAANAYLDAWAQFARARGWPAVSLAWDAWQEVGMAVQTVVPEALRREREENLRTGIAPAEGQQAFARALAAGLPALYVSTRELTSRAQEIAEQVAARKAESRPAAGRPAPAAGTPGAPGAGLHPRPALAPPWVAPRTETEQALCALWGDLLGIAGVGRDDDVFDLGGNSLLLMQLSVRLRSLFGVNLSLRGLFELKTPAARAERVDTLRLASQAGAGETSGETEEVTL
jgi:hypothetical protein